MGHAHAALRPIGPCVLSVQMSVFIIWPRTSIVRNPAIPARALLPRETDIRDLGALATEVQKQHKSAIVFDKLSVPKSQKYTLDHNQT